MTTPAAPAYKEGYLSGMNPSRSGPCNYRAGSKGFTQWVIGYADACEDNIATDAARRVKEQGGHAGPNKPSQAG